MCITDSEGDIHELFAEPRGERPVHWLIHACQDQAVVGQPGQPLRDQVLNTPLLYEVQLRIRGRQSKTTAEDRNRRQNRVTRKANVERCTATLTLRPPWRPDRERPPVTVQVVLVREPTPPPGEPPVEWLLLTTLPIATAEQMRTNVAYYCLRWTIATDCPHYTSSERWCGQHAVGYDEPVRTEGEKGDWTECHDVNTVVSMTQGLDAGPRAACATAVPAAGDVGGPRFATPMPPGHDQLTQRLSRPCRRQPTQRVDEAAAVRRHLLPDARPRTSPDARGCSEQAAAACSSRHNVGGQQRSPLSPKRCWSYLHMTQ